MPQSGTRSNSAETQVHPDHPGSDTQAFKHGYVLALAFFVCLPALGQTGRILGTVMDNTGAVIPGAEVRITHVATSMARSFTTGSTGNYEFPNLALGIYGVRVQMPGFNGAETRIEVESGQMVRQDFRLQVGEVTNVINVRAESPLLQTDTSEVGQVITRRQVIELPLNGRLYTSLVLLAPGVTNRGGQTGRMGFGGLVSVNGSRAGAENYQIDGVTTNSSGARKPQIAPSLEAIQEFRIETSTFRAEQGRGSAIFNLTIRNGTNDFHGSVYDFWRNDGLAANDFFQNQLEDPDSVGATLKRHQFGATFGGPVIPNQTFFFAHYEGERLRQGEIATFRVPTDLERAGDFSQSPGVSFVADPLSGEPFPEMRVPANRFHPVYNYFQGWWPGPNTADGFLISAPRTFLDGDQAGFRIDQVFSGRDNVYFRYYFARRDDVNPGIGTVPFSMAGNRIEIDSHQLVGHWSHSFSPGLLFDFQYSRITFATSASGSLACLREEECTNHVVASGIENMEFASGSYPGPPQLSFGGGGWAQLGGGNDPLDLTYPANSWKVNQTWVKGRHTLKGGIDFYRQDTLVRIGVRARGIFPMTGRATSGGRIPWSDFMLGRTSATSTRAIPPLRSGIDNRSFHYYIQDDWKVSPRLTLNLGLRYEYNLFPTGTDGAGSVDPSTGRLIFADSDGDGSPAGEAANAPAFQFLFPLVEDSLDASSALGLAPSMTRTFKDGFAPRLGLALRPFGDKTVLRAGYGIYYSVIGNGSIGDNQILMPPFSVIELAGPDVIDQVWKEEAPSRLLPGAWVAWAADPNQGWPYENHFSLNLQHSLGANLLLETGYVGRTGIHLISRSRVVLAPDRPSFVPPEVPLHDAGSNSNYHSWQTRLEKRYSSGLAFSTAYTWSKAMDISSEDRDTGGIDSAYNIKAVADHDIPHRLVANAIWDLPFGRGRHWGSGIEPALNAVAGGWQLSLITQFQSGHPFHPWWQTGSNSDRIPIALIPDRIGDGRLASPTPERWFDSSHFAPYERPPDPDRPGRFLLEEGNAGRNILRSDGMANWDLGIMKNFLFGPAERYRLQFRAEMFNAFNHPQFAVPGASPALGRSRRLNNPAISHGPNDGRVFQTFSLPRQVQLALKLYF